MYYACAHSTQVDIRGQLVRVIYLLPQGGSCGLNSGHHVYQQAPLAAEPSCQSRFH